MTTKAQLQALFTFLTPVAKKADLEGEINNTHIRVVIQKDEVKAVKVNGENVWQGEEVTAFIQRLMKKKVTFEEKIEALTRTAQSSTELKEGDEIRFRVARSNGKPVSITVDIYREGEKIGTGGRENKLGWARIQMDEWMARVDEAVRRAYSMMHLYRSPKN